jgi:hypothetical protein
VHSYWVGALVNLLFMVLAYVISVARGASSRDLEGLTVWTPARVVSAGVRRP